MTPEMENAFPLHPEPAPTLESIIVAIEADLPGCMWLLRNDTSHGYFANIINEDGRTFPTWTGDKLEALSLAYNRAKSNEFPGLEAVE